MLGSFRFSKFGKYFLLTNDAGRYVFLSKDEFNSFVSDNMDANTDIFSVLEERLFHYSESQETYIQKAINAVRENRAYIFSPTSLFIIAVTNQCNNRCVYCQAEGHAQAAIMSIDIADKILERIKETPNQSITIEFQGGEPLLNQQAITYIVEQSKEVLKSKQVDYALVSNLSLLTEDMADFIAANNISVSTSIDGPEELHNLNRPPKKGGSSYQSTLRGIDMLRCRGVDVSAIQTTTRASLPYAKEIVDLYAALGFHSVFLRPLTRLGAASEKWDEIGYTAEEFISFYRKGIEEIIELNKSGIDFYESHAAIFLSKILNGWSPNYMELRSPCGATIGQVAITSNGDVYTCDEGRMLAEMGDDSFKVGNVNITGYSDWVNSDVCKAVCSTSLLETLPGCSDCVYQPYCGVCPVINYALEGKLVSSRPYNDHCKIYRGMLDTLFFYILNGNEEIQTLFKKWAGM